MYPLAISGLLHPAVDGVKIYCCVGNGHTNKRAKCAILEFAREMIGSEMNETDRR